jgi:hypothetical protein
MKPETTLDNNKVVIVLVVQRAEEIVSNMLCSGEGRLANHGPVCAFRAARARVHG